MHRTRVGSAATAVDAGASLTGAVVTASSELVAVVSEVDVALVDDDVAVVLDPRVDASSGDDVLAFTGFPRGHWQKIWSNNPIERLNKEIKRRADVVEIFPNPEAFLRLATSVVIDQHDEWQVGRRYLSETSMGELRAVIAAKQQALDASNGYHQESELVDHCD